MPSFIGFRSAPRESNQGLGVNAACSPDEEDNEYDAYRKRMMLAYRFRPNPMVGRNCSKLEVECNELN